MEIKVCASIELFAKAYMEITSRMYSAPLIHSATELHYLEDYTFKGWISEKGCIAAIINPAIRYQDYQTGLLGFFEFDDDMQVSKQLLKQAVAFLKGKNCDYCIGPLNGDTWHKYRITLPNNNDKILMDNENPPYYARHYKSHNFENIAEYISLRIMRDHFEFKRLQRTRPRLEKQDITINKINTGDFERSLHKIYSVCVDSFKNNFLYTPLSFDHFKMIYQGAEKLVHEDYVLIAEHKDKTVGFVFAVPNILNTHRKGVIIKTLAVTGDSATRGLGSYMTELIHQKAYQQGIDEIYHLLMIRSNVSTRIASKVSDLYREYELYGKAI